MGDSNALVFFLEEIFRGDSALLLNCAEAQSFDKITKSSTTHHPRARLQSSEQFDPGFRSRCR